MFDFIGTFLDFLSGIDSWLLILIAGIGIALETSILIGLFIPGDTIVIIASLGMKTVPEYLALLFTVILGSLLGETAGFFIGRFFGPKLRASKAGQKVKNSFWEKADRMIEENAWKALLLSRFTPVLHSLVPVVSGMSKLRYRQFIFWTMISCSAWAALYTTFGFFAASNYRELSKTLHNAALFFFLILLVFILLIIIIKRLVKKQTNDKEVQKSYPQPLHFAAVWENRLHKLLRRWARRHGRVEIINPVMGYGSEEWIRVLGRVLMLKPKNIHTPKDIRGWRSFLSIPVPNVLVRARVNGRDYFFRADRGGVIDIKIPASLPPGIHEIFLSTARSDTAVCQITVVPDNARIGFVSDIDDTIMVTRLPRLFVAAWNAFVVNERARHPVAGMNVFFHLLSQSNPGAPFIYLSTGAWNTAATLDRFMTRNLYPKGPLLLTDWGPTHDRWFRNGQAHKRENLQRLIQEFPRIKWVLIGDSGQHDEDIYSELSQNYPDNVELILIRNLFTFEAFFLGRFRRRKIKPSALPKLRYGHDGSDLLHEVKQLPPEDFTIRS